MKRRRNGGLRGRLKGAFPSAFLMLSALAASFAVPTPAQVERPRIDVDFYDIEANIDVATKTLEARVDVRFTPREATETVVFELHNSSQPMLKRPLLRPRQSSGGWCGPCAAPVEK